MTTPENGADSRAFSSNMTCKSLCMLITLFPIILGVSHDISRRRRRLCYFGSMQELQLSAADNYASSLIVEVARRRRRREEDSEDNDQVSSRPVANKLWPPWPFNLLTTQRGSNTRSSGQDTEEHDYRSNNNISLFWTYFAQRMLITKRQIQHVGSQLWFHLPPAGAPLILLSCIPQRRMLADVEGELLYKVGPAFLVNGFVRNLVLASLGLAILSWSNAEVNRNRRMTPLPLPGQYQDCNRAVLPHFLPEAVPDVDIEILRSMEQQVNDDDIPKPNVVEQQEAEGLSPRLRRHLQNMYQVAERKPRTLRTTIKEWKRMRELRRLEAAKVRRATIMDELIALQALKKKAKGRTKGSNAYADEENDSQEKPLGYAIITGASRGIGRALAVELARWEIPLILIARDVEKLTSLANDIELCYGVKCYVLEADLSKPDAAERIHRTTREAGLDVDFLVSNAGVCSSGLSVDIPNSEIKSMLQINAVSVATLNQLYGKDMKEKGRGRLLVVSSIVGSVEAGPTVACYAATKAFERSFALSIGKELEPYGVGVTCLMPGAVRDTAFKSASDVDEALCWKLPFYARPAPQVAHLGVVGMLEGSVQVVPGWQNRAFLKVFKPMLPQRLTTMVVQLAWSPFRFSLPKPKLPSLPVPKNGRNNGKEKSSRIKSLVDMPTTWPGSTYQKAPPRMLKLPDETSTDANGKDTVEKPLSIEKPEDSARIDDETREDPTTDSKIESSLPERRIESSPPSIESGVTNNGAKDENVEPSSTSIQTNTDVSETKDASDDGEDKGHAK